MISTLAFAAPTDSEGNNLVFDWDKDFPVDCDGDASPDLLANLAG